ncbi:MAG TPA: adenylate/guanylate cyclase domain-containing protein [Candidatus Acidoferrum sp.]|jgi:class 3 adenylate cyclase|nr:adenylate/guanylate cyclase domain-containing protein [Candidatus Acidoferrum sp.]
MPQLSQKARQSLPDSAFAYIDSTGRRRLPINDEAHVRNALARFNQTTFEDEAVRDRARTRLLKAAKKYRIVPVGFMTGQLRSQSSATKRLALENEQMRSEIAARASDVRSLPTGSVTFLLADIADSTGLVTSLGEGYAGLLAGVRRLLRNAIRTSGGREVDTRADEMFAVFEQPRPAIEAALAIQRGMRSNSWPGSQMVLVRVGLHTGRPTLTDTGYVGLAVNTAARICFAAHGGQIVVSNSVKEAIADSEGLEAGFKDLGLHQLRGLSEPVALLQLEVPDLPMDFPPLRIGISNSAKPGARRRPGRAFDAAAGRSRRQP